MIEQWRDEALVGLLPEYLAIRHFVEIDEFLEDAIALVGSLPGSCGLAYRTSALHGVLSLLASAGFTGQNHKWLVHWAARVADPLTRHLAQRGCVMVLGAVPVGVYAERAAIQDLQDFRAGIATALAREPELRAAIDYFASAISYVSEGAGT